MASPAKPDLRRWKVRFVKSAVRPDRVVSTAELQALYLEGKIFSVSGVKGDG